MSRQRPPFPRINRSHPLANGLVFAGLGGGASTLQYADASALGNHGTLTSMDPPTDWVWDTTLNRWVVWFNGTGARIALPVLSLGTNHSFSYWFYTPDYLSTVSGSVRRVVFGNTTNSTNYCCYHTSAQSWYRAADAVDYLCQHAAAVSAATMTHVAVVRNGSTNTLYFNGNSVSVLSDADAAAQVMDHIGARGLSTDRMYGYIGDPSIWDRVLSLSEIQQLADPSNVMLSGMVLPPRRRVWAVAASATKKIPVFMRQYRQRWGA
jgi:hypothetical protein